MEFLPIAPVFVADCAFLTRGSVNLACNFLGRMTWQ